jgi:3-dehydroquinate dehydratase-2
MVSILIMNGPNLNLLGTRQPEVYGATTLKEIEEICMQQAASVGAKVKFFQSNHEGDLIDQIHSARGKFDGIILNAGALSHTSIAIMDAIISVEIPTIDMHLSNIHRREEFRHVSYVAKAAIGSIVGFGPGSYLLAIDAMMMHLGNASSSEKEAEPQEQYEPLATASEEIPSNEVPAAEAPPAPLAEDPSEEATPTEPEPESETGSEQEDGPAKLAADIAAATASAIASQKREIEEAVKSLAQGTAKSEMAPEAKSEAKPEPKQHSKTDAGKPKVSGFNEMFDTPSKEVLDSLGIAAPELNPPGKKEEAPKTGKSPLRSFRKFS